MSQNKDKELKQQSLLSEDTWNDLLKDSDNPDELNKRFEEFKEKLENDLEEKLKNWNTKFNSELNDYNSELKKSKEEIEKNKKKYSKINAEIENSYINIIQIISLVVAVLALILSNVLGFSVLPGNIKSSVLIGYLFIINGIVLTGISFLIFMIQYLFINIEMKKRHSIFIIIPIILYIFGFLMI